MPDSHDLSALSGTLRDLSRRPPLPTADEAFDGRQRLTTTRLDLRADPAARPKSAPTASTPVQHYLRDIGRVPLLDHNGEISISLRIERAETAAARAIVGLVGGAALMGLGEGWEEDERAEAVRILCEDEAWMEARSPSMAKLVDGEQTPAEEWAALHERSVEALRTLKLRRSEITVRVTYLRGRLEQLMKAARDVTRIARQHGVSTADLASHLEGLRRLPSDQPLAADLIDLADHISEPIGIIRAVSEEFDMDLSQARALGRRLITLEKGAQRARSEMIEANLRLVVSIARRYNNRGVPFSDLVQEGNIGLMRAVEKFEHRRGFKFSTYATWWVRQAVGRALAIQGRTVRLPVHVNETLSRIRRVSREWEQDTGSAPTHAQIADELGITEEKVQGFLTAAIRPAQLDAPVHTESATRLGELIPDHGAPDPGERAESHGLHKDLTRALATLTPREERVIRLRFGLGVREQHTLAEVGAVFSVTRERARQLEARALSKLRRPSRAQRLSSHV